MIGYALNVPLAHSGEFHSLQWIVLLAAVLIPAAALAVTAIVGGREK